MIHSKQARYLCPYRGVSLITDAAIWLLLKMLTLLKHCALQVVWKHSDWLWKAIWWMSGLILLWNCWEVSINTGRYKKKKRGTTKTIHSANYADTQHFTASIMDIDEYIEEQMFFQEHKVLELFVLLCVGNALYPFVFVCWSVTATWCLDRRSNLNKYLKVETVGVPVFLATVVRYLKAAYSGWQLVFRSVSSTQLYLLKKCNSIK